MSQVNVTPSGGPPYHDPYADGAAAGINLVALVLVLLVIAVIAIIAWGAFAGHWFGPVGGSNTNVTVQQPRGQAPGGTGVQVQSPSPSASVSPSAAPTR